MDDQSVTVMDELSNVPLNVVIFYSSIVIFMMIIMVAGVYRLCISHTGNDYRATRRCEIHSVTSAGPTTDKALHLSTIYPNPFLSITL